MSLINDVKVGWAMVVSTVGPAVTGLWVALPTIISVVGGLLGIALTVVLIRAQYANGTKARLELKILKEKDAANRRAARDRKLQGLPERRTKNQI